MAKCPCCNGTGRTQMVTVIKTNDGIPCDFPCIECNGTGEVQMTNEEWIKSLDTEGLVDYLYEVHKGGNSVERQRWIENHKERVKMQFRGWLKEIHNE